MNRSETKGMVFVEGLKFEMEKKIELNVSCVKKRNLGDQVTFPVCENTV
jgi:hypothetical protein